MSAIVSTNLTDREICGKSINTDSENMSKTDWVVYKSPLWHKDSVQNRVHPLPDVKVRTSMEESFINDAIRTQVYHYPRKKPIIPVYSARTDKYARAYFQCPLVKTIISRENENEEAAVNSATAPVSCTPRGTQTSPIDIFSKTPSLSMTPSSSMDGHKKFVGSPYKNKEMRARDMLKEEKNLNKLSHRNRVQRTPSVQDIRARETKFTNDAVVTERRRTRFKDIIPQYDASIDRHCKAYFKRQDVQKLIGVTRSREENTMFEYWKKKHEIAEKYRLYGFKENDLPPPEV